MRVWSTSLRQTPLNPPGAVGHTAPVSQLVSDGAWCKMATGLWAKPRQSASEGSPASRSQSVEPV
jgi:hypothetical protein